MVKNANIRGLRRIWAFLPTLRGIPSATEEDLSSQLGCLVGNNLFTSPESGYQLISAILRELRMKGFKQYFPIAR